MIYELLLEGEENALSTTELVKMTGFKSARELQFVIASEREQGCLILSSCQNGGGYFLPDAGEKGRQEIARFVNTLHQRAINTLRAMKAAKEVLDISNGQIEMDSDDCAE